jgi:osmoprotectant transport system substrate-binding protein
MRTDRLRHFFASFIAGAVLALSLTVGALAQTRDRVVVASKIDTEGALLGHMIVLVLEHAKIPMESRVQLGPTKVVRTALVSGEIDLYPEYTGNGAFFHAMENDPAWKSAGSAFATVKRLDQEKHNLVWLDRAPANNTWLIATRGDLAKRENLRTMEDFARIASQPGAITLVGSAEFIESPAALPSFERTYGFSLPREQVIVVPSGDTAITMKAAALGVSGANAAMVYGTDGALSALRLVVMEDTKGAQIVYEPAPVVRADVLQRYPTIGPALGKVFGSLNADRLRQLNAEIVVEGRPSREVAKAYLQKEGLLP